MVPWSVRIHVIRNSLVECDDWSTETEDYPVLVCFRIKLRYVLFRGVPVVGVVDDGVSDALAVSEGSPNERGTNGFEDGNVCSTQVFQEIVIGRIRSWRRDSCTRESSSLFELGGTCKRSDILISGIGVEHLARVWIVEEEVTSPINGAIAVASSDSTDTT